MCDLQLDIDPSMSSVGECLDGLFAKEWLEGENMYRCDRCATLVRASKQLGLEVAPNVLAVCLKRFGIMRNGKNKQAVAYPARLSLDKYLAKGALDDGPAGYRLYAVLVHVDKQGSTTSGHYVALVCGEDGRWWMCDDDEVDEISTTRALSMCAYLLFYIRDAPRPAPAMKQSPAAEQAEAAVVVAMTSSDTIPSEDNGSSAMEQQRASNGLVESNGNGHLHTPHAPSLHLNDTAPSCQSPTCQASEPQEVELSELSIPHRAGAPTAPDDLLRQLLGSSKPRSKAAKVPQPHAPTYPQPRYLLRSIKPVTNPNNAPTPNPAAVSDDSNTIITSLNSPTLPSSTTSAAATLPATLYVRLNGIRSVNDVQVCVVGKHLHLVAKVDIPAAAPSPSHSASKDIHSMGAGEALDKAGISLCNSNGDIESNSSGSSVRSSYDSNCDVSEPPPVQQQHLVLHLMLKQPAVLQKCTLRLSCGQLKVTLGAAVSASAKKHKKKRDAKKSSKPGVEASSNTCDGAAFSGITIESHTAASPENSDACLLDDCLW